MSGTFGGWTDEDTYDLHEEPEHDTECSCADPECDRSHADDGSVGVCFCGEIRVPATEAEARLGFGFWRCPAERREAGYLRSLVVRHRRKDDPPRLKAVGEAIDAWYSASYPFGVRLRGQERESLAHYIAQRLEPSPNAASARVIETTNDANEQAD